MALLFHSVSVENKVFYTNYQESTAAEFNLTDFDAALDFNCTIH